VEQDPELDSDAARIACLASGHLGAWGLGPLPSPVLSALEVYVAELRRWAATINLTGWERPEDLAHGLASSILLAGLLPEGPSEVVDLGSGNGMPAVPCAIARPDLHFALVEPRRKRASFLREVVRTLDLGRRVSVVQGRAEEAQSACTAVAGVTSRALWPPEELLRNVARLWPAVEWVGCYPAPAWRPPSGWRIGAERPYPGPRGQPVRAARVDRVGNGEAGASSPPSLP